MNKFEKFLKSKFESRTKAVEGKGGPSYSEQWEAEMLANRLQANAEQVSATFSRISPPNAAHVFLSSAKLQVTDLISEGPIEGFVNLRGERCSAFEGTYLDNTAISEPARLAKTIYPLRRDFLKGVFRDPTTGIKKLLENYKFTDLHKGIFKFTGVSLDSHAYSTKIPIQDPRSLRPRAVNANSFTGTSIFGYSRAEDVDKCLSHRISVFTKDAIEHAINTSPNETYADGAQRRTYGVVMACNPGRLASGNDIYRKTAGGNSIPSIKAAFAMGKDVDSGRGYTRPPKAQQNFYGQDFMNDSSTGITPHGNFFTNNIPPTPSTPNAYTFNRPLKYQGAWVFGGCMDHMGSIKQSFTLRAFWNTVHGYSWRDNASQTNNATNVFRAQILRPTEWFASGIGPPYYQSEFFQFHPEAQDPPGLLEPIISGLDRMEGALPSFRKYSVTDNFNTGAYINSSAISTAEQSELESHLTGTDISIQFARKFMVYDPYTTGIRCLSTADGSRINPSTGLCEKIYFHDAGFQVDADNFNGRIGAQFRQKPTTDNDFQFYAALGDHFRFDTNNQSRFKVSYYYFIPSTNFKLNRLRGGVSNERFHTGGRFAQAFHLTDGSLVPTASDTVVGSWTLHTGLLKANLTNTSCPDGITGAELLIMGAHGSDTSNDFYNAGDNGDSFYLSDVTIEQITTEEVGETASSLPTETNTGNFSTLVFEATGHFRDKNERFSAGFSFENIIGRPNPHIANGQHLSEGTEIQFPENPHGFGYVIPTITGFQRVHNRRRYEQYCYETSFGSYQILDETEPNRARLFNITGVRVYFGFNGDPTSGHTGFDHHGGNQEGLPNQLVPVTTNMFNGAFTWPVYIGKSGEAISGLEDGDFSRIVVDVTDSASVSGAKIQSGIDLDYDVFQPIQVATPVQGVGDGLGASVSTGEILKTGLMGLRYDAFWSEPSGSTYHIPPSGTTINYGLKNFHSWDGSLSHYTKGLRYSTGNNVGNFSNHEQLQFWSAYGLTLEDGYTPHPAQSYGYDNLYDRLGTYASDKFCAVGARTEYRHHMRSIYNEHISTDFHDTNHNDRWTLSEYNKFWWKNQKNAFGNYNKRARNAVDMQGQSAGDAFTQEFVGYYHCLRTGPHEFRIEARGGYALGWIEHDSDIKKWPLSIDSMSESGTNYRNYYSNEIVVTDSITNETVGGNRNKFQLIGHQALFMFDPGCADLKIDTETSTLVGDSEIVHMVSGRLYAVRFLYSCPGHRYDRFIIKLGKPNTAGTSALSPSETLSTNLGRFYHSTGVSYNIHDGWDESLRAYRHSDSIFDYSPIQAQINSGGSGITDYGPLSATATETTNTPEFMNTFKNFNTVYTKMAFLNQYNFPEWGAAGLNYNTFPTNIVEAYADSERNDVYKKTTGAYVTGITFDQYKNPQNNNTETITQSIRYSGVNLVRLGAGTANENVFGLSYANIATGVKRSLDATLHRDRFIGVGVAEKEATRYNYNNVAIDFRNGEEFQTPFSSFQKTDYVLSRALYGPANQIPTGGPNDTISEYPGSSSYFSLTGGFLERSAGIKINTGDATALTTSYSPADTTFAKMDSKLVPLDGSVNILSTDSSDIQLSGNSSNVNNLQVFDYAGWLTNPPIAQDEVATSWEIKRKEVDEISICLRILRLGYQETYYTKPTGPQVVNDKIPLNLSLEFGFRGIDDPSIFTNKIIRVTYEGIVRSTYATETGPHTLPKYEEIIDHFPNETIDSLSQKHKRFIRVRKLDHESNSQRLNRQVMLYSITEIVKCPFSYPLAAMVRSRIDARTFAQVPSRTYNLRLKKILVPSNYFPLTLNGIDLRFNQNAEFVRNAVQRIKNNNLTTDLQGVNYNFQLYQGDWDGTFKLAWSDNPAWIVYDMLINPTYGIGTRLDDLNDIDIWSLYKIGRYCDGVDEDGFYEGVFDGSNGVEPRFSCNLYLDGSANAFQRINEVCTIFNGKAFWSNGGISFYSDRPQPVSAHFNNSNVYDGIFTYADVAKSSNFNVVNVSYQDRYDDFKIQLETVEDEDGIRKDGKLTRTIRAKGSTSRGQARRLAKYVLYTNKLEREIVNFKADAAGLSVNVGDVISIADDLKAFDFTTARVIDASVIDTTIVPSRLEQESSTDDFLLESSSTEYILAENQGLSFQVSADFNTGDYIDGGHGEIVIFTPNRQITKEEIRTLTQTGGFVTQDILDEYERAQSVAIKVDSITTGDSPDTYKININEGRTNESITDRSLDLTGYIFNCPDGSIASISLRKSELPTYRVMSISPEEGNLYDIKATEYVSGKFNFIDAADEKYDLFEPTGFNVGAPINTIKEPGDIHNFSVDSSSTSNDEKLPLVFTITGTLSQLETRYRLAAVSPNGKRYEKLVDKGDTLVSVGSEQASKVTTTLKVDKTWGTYEFFVTPEI